MMNTVAQTKHFKLKVLTVSNFSKGKWIKQPCIKTFQRHQTNNWLTILLNKLIKSNHGCFQKSSTNASPYQLCLHAYNELWLWAGWLWAGCLLERELNEQHAMLARLCLLVRWLLGSHWKPHLGTLVPPQRFLPKKTWLKIEVNLVKKNVALP